VVWCGVRRQESKSESYLGEEEVVAGGGALDAREPLGVEHRRGVELLQRESGREGEREREGGKPGTLQAG
jgi:hypothetical protein